MSPPSVRCSASGPRIDIAEFHDGQIVICQFHQKAKRKARA